MAQLGTGAYPVATELDADDRIVILVDGAVQEAPGSLAKAFMSPTGLIDVNDHTAVAESLQAAMESTSGWTTSNSHTAPTTSTAHTQGTNSVRLTPYMTTLQPLASGYYTFSSPLTIGDNTHFAVDLRISLDGPSGVYAFEDIEWVIADSTALSGNTQVIKAPNVGVDIFQTLRFPLEGLSQIKSFGYRVLQVRTGASTARAVLFVDNARFPARTKLENALIDDDVVGVIVGDYDSSGESNPYIPADKSYIDLARAAYAKFNGTIWLDACYIDPSGESDVCTALSQVINSAPPGSTVKAKAGGHYRLDRRLTLSGLKDVVVDFTDATVFHYQPTTKTEDWFAEVVDSANVTVRGGLWLGWGKRPYVATSMTSVAGTPTNNGSSKELNAQDEEVREPVVANWLVAPHYCRHLPQQLGLPRDSDPPRNYFQYTLSDTAQVANDCVISIYEDWDGSPNYGDLLQETTLTLTGTPTVYTIEYIPTAHVRSRLKVTVRKDTATANTITITAPSPWGKSEYNATYDGAACWRVERSTNTRFEDMWIEGFAGDAIQVSENGVHGVHVRNCTSYGCSRQGMSFNAGTGFLIENVDIYTPGRSGIDFEPYVDTNYTQDVLARNLRMYDIVNYGFAMANWARNISCVIEGVDFYNNRLGCVHGGMRGGYFHNLRSWDYDGDEEDFQFFGGNMLVENVLFTKKVRCYAETSTFDDGGGADTFTPNGNVLRNLHCLGSGLETKIFLNTGYILDGATLNPQTQSDFTNTAVTFGPVEVVDGVYHAVNLGEYHRQLPNTFKGPLASSGIWFVEGVNNYDDPAYNTRSLSGTTTKGNNLRGINVSVTQTASSLAVTFPTRNNGSLVATTNYTLTAFTGGSLSPSTTYYYRVAPRGRFSGPSTYGSQLSVALNGSQNAVIVKLKTLISVANDRLITGATVLRGTTNGGPYTTRYDILPVGLAGMIPLATDFVDTGTALTGGGIGYDDSRAAQSGSWNGSVDESGYEPDATYAVVVTPNWATSVYVTNKTTAGFTINFGTAAPASASVDWFIVR